MDLLCTVRVLLCVFSIQCMVHVFTIQWGEQLGIGRIEVGGREVEMRYSRKERVKKIRTYKMR